MDNQLTPTENKSHSFQVLLYYQYASLENPEQLVITHTAFCKKHDLKGRILIAQEGINGTCAGSKEAIDAYKQFVWSIPGLEKTMFKEHAMPHNPFQKLKVRARKELVALNVPELELHETALHVSPAQFHNLVEQSKTDPSIVIMDVRNEIESRVGHFENAICPPIRYFRDFPKVLNQYEHLKDKKVAIYCTGGIRCEKASVLLKKAGFQEVCQLDGGIYNYCTQYPEGNFKGTCFVFDERMQIAFTEEGAQSVIPEEKVITSCEFCQEKCSRIANDERVGRHLVVCCESCDNKLGISHPHATSLGEKTQKVDDTFP